MRSLAGASRAITELDVEALLARYDDVRLAVLSSAAGGCAQPDGDRPLRDIGRKLFAASLGTGELAGGYRASAALAAGAGGRGRLTLRGVGSALARLPWEAMYDDAASRYVCRRDQLVRNVEVAAATVPLEIELPLRILAVVSAPAGPDELDTGQEKRQLMDALSPLVAEQRAELVWAPSAAWPVLQETLLDGPWHVLHFIGHGRFGAATGQGELALTRPDGGVDWIEASRLVDLLRQADPMPQLVVLNSCSGATTGATDLFSSTASALIRGDVNAVAAMQFEFSDQAAPMFAHGFYAALARGRGVDEAVTSGRVAIMSLSGRTLEWVTPVLYTRGLDNHLFSIPAPGRADRSGPGRSTQPRDTPAAPRAVLRHPAGVRCLAFSRSQPLLASAGDDGAVHLWQVPPGTNVQQIRSRARPVTSLAFSADGLLLVSAGLGDPFTWLWETATGARVRKLGGHDTGVLGVAVSPDGDLLASAGADGIVNLRTMPGGAQIRALTAHGGPVHSVAFSSDGRWLASGSSDRTVRLWALPPSDEAPAILRHADPVTSLAYDQQRNLLATAAGPTIQLWDPAARTVTRTLADDGELAYDVAFSPRGQLLASGGADNTARLWDLSSGRELQRLTGHEAPVTSVAFSVDGSLLATGSSDRTVHLWAVAEPGH
jgi:WD40 repeat protein